MTKTIKEWLSELPDGYRERALVNTDEDAMENKEESMDNAIAAAFFWNSSHEGHKFWSDVLAHYSLDYPLPPLP